jgi:hypothetical protein
MQAMCQAIPSDAGAPLADVTCSVVNIEGSLFPDWADLHAAGEKISADPPPSLGELAVIDGTGHHPHTRTREQVLALALLFRAETLARA